LHSFADRQRSVGSGARPRFKALLYNDFEPMKGRSAGDRGIGLVLTFGRA
jgi:hypothetical protein